MIKTNFSLGPSFRLKTNENAQNPSSNSPKFRVFGAFFKEIFNTVPCGDLASVNFENVDPRFISLINSVIVSTESDVIKPMSKMSNKKSFRHDLNSFDSHPHLPNVTSILKNLVEGTISLHQAIDENDRFFLLEDPSQKKNLVECVPLLHQIIDKILCLQPGDESYLSIERNEYAATVEMLRRLVLPFHDARLLAKLNANDRQEQRLLLQYATPSDLVALQQAYMDPRLESVIELVNNGQWNEFLRDLLNFPVDQSAYLFLAAYCKKLISIETLSTAMLVCRAYIQDPHGVTVETFDTLTDADFARLNISGKEKAELIFLLGSDQIERNQKMFVLSSMANYDPYTLGLFSDFSKEGKIPSVFGDEEKVGVFSFGIAKALYGAVGVSLVPVLHLTPRQSMISRISSTYSDCVLLLPREKSLIHGSRNGIIFPAIHDYYHANKRSQHSGDRALRESAKMAAQKIQDHLSIGPQDYLSKLSDGQNELYRQFSVAPAKDEYMRYIFRRISGQIIDAEYSTKSSAYGNCIDVMPLLDSVAESILLSSYTQCDGFADRAAEERWFDDGLFYSELKETFKGLLDLD